MLPTKALADAIIIRDWVVANRSSDAAKRFLTQVSACCHWAMKFGRQGLETQELRKFPANRSLQALLKAIQTEWTDPEVLVFPSPEGKYIDFHNFRNRAWSSILQTLPTVRYRETLANSPYVHYTGTGKWVGSKRCRPTCWE